MKGKKATKRALLSSALSLVLCFSMLLGTTFAWFTDEAKTGVNTIQSGKLKIQLLGEDSEGNYTADLEGVPLEFVKATGGEGQDVLWEPGATYHTQGFRIKNAGNLWLKFEIVINGVSDGNAKLLEAIDFVISTDKEGKNGISLDNNGKMHELAPGDIFNDATYYLVGHMDENAENEYQDLTIEGVGITVYATQLEAEYDSFGNDYDAAAPVATYEVNPENIQDYLDGKYGSTSNMKLVLTEGDYGTLVLGRPTKYAGSNTTYICGKGNPHTDVVFETTDVDDFRTHLADNKWHTTPKYVTSLRNLQITVQEGADVRVAGVQASTGHANGDVYDYVRDIDYDAGSAYYSTLLMQNVTFTGVTFVAASDINTSDAETIIDGVTFENCTFTGTSTEAETGAAIRYYNEANDGNVRNLTVTGCTFNNWYQGVYTHHVNGITVTNNTFDTTGHNAVAIQGGSAVDHGAVVISNNTFTDIGDRVIRFNNVGSGTQITIKFNKATNSGDDANEVIKATSIAADVECDVKYNDWGEGAVVVNKELKDTDEDAVVVFDTTELKDAIAAGATEVLLAAGEYTANLYDISNCDSLTITGQGADSVIAFSNLQVRASQFKELTISNCTIERMPNKSWGHLVFGSSSEAGGVYTIENCTFNGVGSQGIYINQTVGATFNIENCTFNGDFGSEGAITVEQTANGALTINVTGCTFNDIPETSHEIFVHYAHDGWTLNAPGVDAYWKANS